MRSLTVRHTPSASIQKILRDGSPNLICPADRQVAGVVDRDEVLDQLGRIKTLKLIIVGEEDVAKVPEKSEHMHRAIPGAQLVRIPHAGHSSPLEEPAAVTAALTEFLQTIDS